MCCVTGPDPVLLQPVAAESVLMVVAAGVIGHHEVVTEVGASSHRLHRNSNCCETQKLL